MTGVEDALKVVGNEPIKNLFDFVSVRLEMTDPNANVFEWVEALRTAGDVGLAIYGYAVSKERINAKD